MGRTSLSALGNTHSRILASLGDKVGVEAAELEYQVFVDRLWISGASLVTFVFIGTAIKTQSWIFGGVAIALYVSMLALTVRMYIFRHRYFLAVSAALRYRVTWRHPVRGLPNWRRPLRDDQLERLNKKFLEWCAERNIVPITNPELAG